MFFTKKASSSASPLTSSQQGYQSVDQNHDVEIQLVSSIANNAIKVGQEKLNTLQHLLADNQYTWKYLAYTAGYLMIFSSLMDLFSKLLSSFSITGAILNIYIISFGIITIILENKDIVIPLKYRLRIKKEFHFLHTPYGKAGFYFFIGTLMLSIGGLLSMLVGLYTAFIGVYMYFGTKVALDTLRRMKGDTVSEATAIATFKEFDVDKSGTLDKIELQQLCRRLGHDMTANELESAMAILEKEDDGTVTQDEFVAWYMEKDD